MSTRVELYSRTRIVPGGWIEIGEELFRDIEIGAAPGWSVVEDGVDQFVVLTDGTGVQAWRVLRNRILGSPIAVLPRQQGDTTNE